MRKPRAEISRPEDTNRLRAAWDRKKKELRLTQEIAADLLGFDSQATVSHYLNGRAPLNTDAALKFAALLKIKPEELRPDLIDMLNYVRASGTFDENFSGTGWRVVTPEQAQLLDIFDKLPESERTKQLENLKGLNTYYDEVFEEILAARKGKK
jgi:Helix-turn-helix.